MDFQTPPNSFPLNLQFYSAPSSPMPVDSRSDDYERHGEFEFETTRRITNCCEFQQTYPNFGCTTRNDNEQQTHRLPARAKSFCILPLKLPPRLQSSVSMSPRSPNSLLRFPFARPCSTWNDDFDPFQVALEKVSEETRARMSVHRRSHSCSAYRTSGVAYWLEGSVDWAKEHQGSNQLKPKGPTLAKLMDRRESVYLRRVPNDQPNAEPRSKLSRMGHTETKDHEPIKSRSESSSLQRVISVVVKYATMKKARKTSWKLRRCLGYAPGSPPFMK